MLLKASYAEIERLKSGCINSKDNPNRVREIPTSKYVFQLVSFQKLITKMVKKKNKQTCAVYVNDFASSVLLGIGSKKAAVASMKAAATHRALIYFISD